MVEKAGRRTAESEVIIPRKYLSPQTEALASLAEQMGIGQGPEEIEVRPIDLWNQGWRPRLNPTQQKAHDSEARLKLYHGERGSGKTRGVLGELVEHCFLEDNSLGMVIVKFSGQAKDGGAWDELYKAQNNVLDTFRYGNMDREGNRLDEGIGLEWEMPVHDAQTHLPHIKLRNQFGTWSDVMLISLPVDKQVMDKVKGKAPSFIMVDEAQTLESDSYFKFLLQQLGRRRGIRGPQKAIYCANPKGPSHWLWKTFLGEGAMIRNEKTGELKANPIQAAFHIPVKENLHNLPPDYYANLVRTVADDPVEEARNLRGEWIDTPEGNALFSDFSDLCIRGDRTLGLGFLPLPQHPVIVSFDLGAPNSSIHFLQLIWTANKRYISYFDELDYVGRDYQPYRIIVPHIIQRFQFWERICGQELRWDFISDASSFHAYRAKDGSYDAADVEALSLDYVRKNNLPFRYVIKMQPCPRGHGSIAGRTRMIRDTIINDELRVSATCTKLIDMFYEIEEDKNKPLEPRDDRRHVHRYDSATYGPWFYNTKEDGRPGRMPILRPGGFSLYSNG